MARSPLARSWPPVLATALVWGGLALSAGHWGLKWWGEAPAQPLPVPTAAALNIDTGRVAAALGARAAAAAPAVSAPVAALGSRLQLLGVVTDRSGMGAALLAVDGQPARPYRVGAVLFDGVRLISLGARHAEVGGDAGHVRLTLPEKAAASAVGTSPGTPAGGLPAALPGVMPPVSAPRFVRP